MCLIDSCFGTLSPDATPKKQVQHHLSKAVVALILTLIAGACFVNSICSVISPLTGHEWAVIILWGAATIVPLVKTVYEISKTWKAYKLSKEPSSHAHGTSPAKSPDKSTTKGQATAKAIEDQSRSGIPDAPPM